MTALLSFGPTPPKKLPVQDQFKVLLLAERWQRASWAHQSWAERALKAWDFFEGRQYSMAQIEALKRQRRPSLKFNVIAPLVRLVQGYHGNHKTDITFQPGSDSRSSDQVAEALTRLEKAIATGCGMEFVDVEVFLDGLVGGRAFYDTRLDWKDNDLGEVKTRSGDPFATYVDPDCSTYDVNESASYMQTSKMVSIDEIEGTLGKATAELIRPFTMGQTPLAPIASLALNEELTPLRFFGERDDAVDWWDQFYNLVGDFVDTHRKTIRIIETQYKVREPRNVMIDLETGDKKTLPEDWSPEKIQKALLYCQQIGNPCVVENRMVERIHWTTMCGDVLLYDAPSYYDRYTQDGYFPYFRRGFTKGMVEDLIDPQMEKNKRRNAMIEIVGRTANGGWIYHEKSLNPKQKRNLKRYGSTPGVNIEYQGDGTTVPAPKPIEVSQSPLKHERLEQEADEDIRAISGINPSALGEIDRVQSGRAIEARQRQAVLSVQSYLDNHRRSKIMVGQHHLQIIQNNYTEPRFYRVLGEDGRFVQLLINQSQQDPATGFKRIINDVTIGKYTAIVDMAPLSATFLQGQWEETMTLLEKLGPIVPQIVPAVFDLILAASSLPRKEEWIQRVQQVIGGGQPVAGGAPGGQPQLAPPQQGGAPALAAPTPQG
jgi:hypothetical protein